MKYLSGVLMVLSFCISQAQDGTFSRPDIPGDVMVDIGINQWSETPDSLNTKGFASKSLGIYYSKRKAFSSKLSLNYGIGLSFEKIAFEEDSTLFYTNSILSMDALPFIGVKKNKLAITYVDIPFDLRFHPKGTEDGEGLFIAAGGILGLRMNAHTKWKFDDGGGNTIIKTADKFNLSDFRYGYQIRAGYKGVHLFYKRFLSDTFKDNIGNANPTLTTIGINVTGF